MKNNFKLALAIGIFTTLIFAVVATANTLPQNTILDLVLDKFKVMQGETFTVDAKLTLEDNSPVAEKTVNFYLNDEKVGEDVTDEIGAAEMLWDTSSYEPGAYILGVDFLGDDMLDASSDSYAIVVEAETESLPVVAGVKELMVPTTNLVEKQNVLSANVKKFDDCDVTVWEEEQDVIGTCTEEYTKTVCDDAPLNLSCNEITNTYDYDCVTGTEVVTKTKEDCAPKSVLVNNAVKIHLDDYMCTTTEENGLVVAICDSKNDGNGDGICRSGESCMKFVIDGDKITSYEKNSRDGFVESDGSFFLNRAKVEVIK